MSTNTLPAIVGEVGLLCCACVHSNPEEAVSQIVEPILVDVISSFEGTSSTGFGGGGTFNAASSSKVACYIIMIFCFNVVIGFSSKLRAFFPRLNPLFHQLLRLQLSII